MVVAAIFLHVGIHAVLLACFNDIVFQPQCCGTCGGVPSVAHHQDQLSDAQERETSAIIQIHDVLEEPGILACRLEGIFKKFRRVLELAGLGLR